jgi:hypothetical protein
MAGIAASISPSMTRERDDGIIDIMVPPKDPKNYRNYNTFSGTTTAAASFHAGSGQGSGFSSFEGLQLTVSKKKGCTALHGQS